MGLTVHSRFAHALLPACAAAVLGRDVSRDIEAALDMEAADWPALVVLSLQQGLAQALAVLVAGRPEDRRIPVTVRACLERMLRATEARNAVLFQETARLVQALEKAGISCLALKGVGLALTVYPDSTLRSFADIDLLVDPQRYEAAGQVAEACGYTQDRRFPELHAIHQIYITEVADDILTQTLAPEFDPEHAGPFIDSVCRQVKVEIHRTLSHLPDSGRKEDRLEAFRAHSQTIALPDGVPVRIPAPESMLVHLAAHAYQHGHARLQFPLDIALVLQTYAGRIDWNRLLCLADRYRARRDLYLMLEFTRREWSSPVPEEFLRRLRSAWPPSQVPRPLTTDAMLGARENTLLMWTRLMRGKSLRQRLPLIRRLLFPAPEEMRRRYGAQTTLSMAVRYLLRPFHLAGHALSVLRAIALRRLSARRARSAKTRQEETRSLPPAAPQPEATGPTASLRSQPSEGNQRL